MQRAPFFSVSRQALRAAAIFPFVMLSWKGGVPWSAGWSRVHRGRRARGRTKRGSPQSRGHQHHRLHQAREFDGIFAAPMGWIGSPHAIRTAWTARISHTLGAEIWRGPTPLVSGPGMCCWPVTLRRTGSFWRRAGGESRTTWLRSLTLILSGFIFDIHAGRPLTWRSTWA